METIFAPLLMREPMEKLCKYAYRQAVADTRCQNIEKRIKRCEYMGKGAKQMEIKTKMESGFGDRTQLTERSASIHLRNARTSVLQRRV